MSDIDYTHTFLMLDMQLSLESKLVECLTGSVKDSGKNQIIHTKTSITAAACVNQFFTAQTTAANEFERPHPPSPHLDKS